MTPLLIDEVRPFQLHSTCQVVSGAQRSLIVDIYKGESHLIPNILANILRNSAGKTIAEIMKEYANSTEDKEILAEYIAFLYENDIILFSNKLECYTNLSLHFDTPDIITNAIVDVRNFSTYRLGNIFLKFQILNIRYIQVRFLEQVTVKNIQAILSLLSSRVEALEIILPYNEKELEELLYLFSSDVRLQAVVLYGGNSDEIMKISNNSRKVIVTTNQINSVAHCGNISKHYFSVSRDTFTESQQHNTCLNRKISIDADGYIKNCPSMAHHFGHISDTRLEDVVQNPEFTKYWYIHKDQISVCRDCEFRHICTDCRAYIEDPTDLHSKPLKCGYNPYTCEWEEWSTNPLKQKAIEAYGLQEVALSSRTDNKTK